MIPQQQINPLQTAIVCPNCKENAPCLSATSFGQIKWYTYLCKCSTVIIVPEAPVVGELTRDLPEGGQVMLGMVMMPVQKGLILPKYHTKDSPSTN